MRCDLSILAAGIACLAPLASAQGSWGHNTPVFTTPGWGSPTASPTWGTIASTGWGGAKNTSGPWATGGTTAVPKPTTWHSAPVPTPPQQTWNSPVAATSTGGAAAMASSFAGLVFAGGVAVLAL